MTLTPLHLQMIDALAAQAAQDYLTEEAASQQASEPDRADHVPLPAFDEAA